MADHWYHTQAGQVRGPVSTDRIRQLLASGEIKPEQEVWAGNPDRALASEVRTASALGAAPSAPAVPDWLDDVARAEQAAQAKSGAGKELDWLADVEIPPGPVNVELAAGPVTPPVPAAGPVEVAPLEEEVATLPPAPRVTGPSRLLAGGATSRGMVRDRNEDHFLAQQLVWSAGEEWHELALLAVCDGVGGHNAGDRASSLAVRSFATTLAPVLAGILQNPSRDAGAAVLARHLDKAIQDAHAAICRRAESDKACKGMAATAAVVAVWDDQAFIRHVGDCRVYHLEGGKFQQVTRDQTLVARMVELGQLTPEQAQKHPARNEVTQALGKRGSVDPSQESLLLEPGDRLVLASDGLAAHVGDRELASIVTSWKGSAPDLAARLVDLANEGGGSDNCTVLTLFYA
jgi:protein phosphatase